MNEYTYYLKWTRIMIQLFHKLWQGCIQFSDYGQLIGWSKLLSHSPLEKSCQFALLADHDRTYFFIMLLNIIKWFAGFEIIERYFIYSSAIEFRGFSMILKRKFSKFPDISRFSRKNLLSQNNYPEIIRKKNTAINSNDQTSIIMMKMIIPSGPRPPQAAEKNRYFSSFLGKNRGYSPLVFYTFETRGGITARNTTDVQNSTFLPLFRTPFWAFPPWYLHFRAPKTVQKSCGRTDGRTN